MAKVRSFGYTIWHKNLHGIKFYGFTLADDSTVALPVENTILVTASNDTDVRGVPKCRSREKPS